MSHGSNWASPAIIVAALFLMASVPTVNADDTVKTTLTTVTECLGFAMIPHEVHISEPLDGAPAGKAKDDIKKDYGYFALVEDGRYDGWWGYAMWGETALGDCLGTDPTKAVDPHAARVMLCLRLSEVYGNVGELPPCGY